MGLAAAPARAETQLEPIVRIGVTGGYDSNPLYDGRGDVRTGISPDVGLKVHDHDWSFLGEYGADYLKSRNIQPNGVWNQRATFALSAAPTPRTRIEGSAHAILAEDPIGLAQAGIFVVGQTRGLLITGLGHAEQDLDPQLVLGGRYNERYVRFSDATGGAMHAPSIELLHRFGGRLLLGGAYAFTIFQDFHPANDLTAYAQALRARGIYKITRFLEVDAYAGPAIWSGPAAKALVPEAGVELRLTERDWDLRAAAWHALGLGSTANPGLVNGIEFGTVRRFGRDYDLRADGGLWQSGEVPDGKNPTLGFAFSGEAGWHVTKEVRLAVGGSYTARLDDPSPLLRRATLGVRMSWELPVR
jgi:hypothetical protein